MIRIIVLALALLWAAPAHAELTTEKFVELCGFEEHRYCRFYMLGVIDLWREQARLSGTYTCLPNFKGDELVDIILSWVERHPESKELRAAVTIATVLYSVFPCGQRVAI
ncbi:MAG: Rap1a/Tai family immunity protein [Acetobacteraceae bacterium]